MNQKGKAQSVFKGYLYRKLLYKLGTKEPGKQYNNKKTFNI